MTSRRLSAAALAAASALLLAGCATSEGAEPSDDGRLDVVASTNVYGQLVEEIGGDVVDVTSLITSTAQDPHAFQASAQDQLVVASADLVIENGGGYDPFIDDLIEASGTSAHVISAVEFSPLWTGGSAHDDSGDDHADDHGHEHIEGFNEHVWYDPATMAALVQGIASELEALSPDDADTFAAAADRLVAEIAGLEASLADIAAAHAGEDVFATEPVPLYLVEAAGLTDVAPPAFTEAVEEGQDVAPAVLLESIKLLEGGDVRIVLINAQTAGAETAQVASEADANGIPIAEFAETLPEGHTYISWMQENIEQLQNALEE
ncbi:metal ABC transporter solute-binding protein, Zn/Mn family [Microbacterium sp. SS28]|uniref:metal ABC transporter solute-binding protein, Zn/Mn family n=1 Tax=Microbacterium sp. SS28 TaxID=2919948 RepID=UPI001FAAEA88|nr:zinc ABC transporter substrate-binding protein [Microbacterium sp. SS28]